MRKGITVHWILKTQTTIEMRFFRYCCEVVFEKGKREMNPICIPKYAYSNGDHATQFNMEK